MIIKMMILTVMIMIMINNDVNSGKDINVP